MIHPVFRTEFPRGPETLFSFKFRILRLLRLELQGENTLSFG